MEIRRATDTDAAHLTELFALAFNQDPTWSWAFPDPERRLGQHRALWGLFLRSGLTYRSVWMTADGGAAALWIPPDTPELTAEDAACVEPLLRECLGARADEVLTLMERFEAHHPRHAPHAYLSLLGTHPAHRGQGKGMALLAATLAATDAVGVPTYLESSNRANDDRYARLGYEQVAEFAAPSGGPSIACMWREPRRPAET